MVAPAAMNTVAGVMFTLDGSLLLSVTFTPRWGADFVKLTGKVTDWLVPTLTLTGKLIAPELDAVFAIWKTARADTPDTDASTEYVPAVELAVNAADVATPAAFVRAVLTPPANDPPGPDAGGVNMTTTPETGFPPASERSRQAARRTYC